MPIIQGRQDPRLRGVQVYRLDALRGRGEFLFNVQSKRLWHKVREIVKLDSQEACVTERMHSTQAKAADADLEQILQVNQSTSSIATTA